MLSNPLLRRIIVGVLLLALIFFGAILRNDGKNKSKIPQIKTFGIALQIAAVVNALVLMTLDYQYDVWGSRSFSIAFLVCLVLDLILVLFIVRNVNKIIKNAREFDNRRK